MSICLPVCAHNWKTIHQVKVIFLHDVIPTYGSALPKDDPNSKRNSKMFRDFLTTSIPLVKNYDLYSGLGYSRLGLPLVEFFLRWSISTLALQNLLVDFSPYVVLDRRTKICLFLLVFIKFRMIFFHLNIY